jgi:hypothetical protein
MRLESGAVKLVAAQEDRPAVAAPREVSIIPAVIDICLILIRCLEFAHGKVDPHEAGRQGGQASGGSAKGGEHNSCCD